VKLLTSYLKEFPNMNKDVEKTKPFWMDEPGRDTNGVTEPDGVVEGDDDKNAMNTEVSLIIATMPNPEARWYFGPHNERPSAVAVTTALRRIIVVAMDGARTTTSTIGAEDPFPPFNSKSDIRVWHFVGLTVEPVEVRAGIPRVVHVTSRRDVRMSVITSGFKPHIRQDRIFPHIFKTRFKLFTIVNKLDEKNLDMDGRTSRQVDGLVIKWTVMPSPRDRLAVDWTDKPSPRDGLAVKWTV
jgi:hypothetical protein